MLSSNFKSFTYTCPPRFSNPHFFTYTHPACSSPINIQEGKLMELQYDREVNPTDFISIKVHMRTVQQKGLKPQGRKSLPAVN